MVKQFNETYKAKDIQDKPTIPNETQMKAWGDIVIEELQELAIAHSAKDPVEFFDAVCDILYAMAQQADLYGWPIAEGLREVHRSNMSKLDEEGNHIIREDGKVLKGPLFTPPELGKFVTDHVVNEEFDNVEE